MMDSKSEKEKQIKGSLVSLQGCIKLVAAGILPAVSGGFQPPGRGPGAFSSGETPDLRRQKASLMQPCRWTDEAVGRIMG
jgi:hypothetical protein